MRSKVSIMLICALLFPCVVCAQETEKIGVLITGWGMPAWYNFGYAWASPDLAQIGDRTEYEGQPCKIGHVGEFPYLSHQNFIPWPILFSEPGAENFYETSLIFVLSIEVCG